MKTLGRFAACAAATMLCVGLSGCGSADSTVDNAAGQAGSAAQSANEATSAKALTSTTFVSAVTKAMMDAKTAHIDMSVDMSGKKMNVIGDIEAGDSPKDTKMAMQMTLPGVGNIEMRLIHDVVYLKMGSMGGDKYFTLDLSDPSSPFGAQFGDMLNKMNPAQSVQAFEGAITSLKKAGSPEQIDGVQTQPYEVVVDTTKLSDTSKGLVSGENKTDLPKKLDFTFWIGPDNLPRKLSSDGPAGASTQMTFTKWGEDLGIEAPPKNKITKKSPFGALPRAS